MVHYIALLRGVNVGGIVIRSVELRELFQEIGLHEVRTVLASGNVAFAASEDADRTMLKQRIERALGDRFGYDAWIVLLTRVELEAIVAAFPFDADREGWHPYVLFGSDEAHLDELAADLGELDAVDDVVERGHGVLYWHNRRASGIGSAFAKRTARARYKPTTTNRNLRTLQKLLA